jgi:hypothetical protein
MRQDHDHDDDHEHGEHEHERDDRFPLPPRVVRAAHHWGGGYLYRPGQLVVPTADLGRLRRELERRGLRQRGDARPISGTSVALVNVAGSQDPDLIPRLVEELRTAEDPHPMMIAPNTVLWGATHARPFTVAPPDRAEALREPGADEPGAGVTVAVLDGGVDPDHPWFAGRVRPAGPGDVETPPPPGSTLPVYAGHGTFVAGLVLLHAPGATVLARRVFDDFGIVDDVTLATAIAELPPEVGVCNLSLGGYAHGDAGTPAIADALATAWERNPVLVVVAAAGNDATTRPAYPAAYKRVIAVGAIDANGNAACFTNSGPWVDAVAPGVDAVSTFLTVEAEPAAVPDSCLGVKHPGTVVFEGFARWSGTSASAPRVAGAIAAVISPGVDGPSAAFILVGSATVKRARGLGAVVDPPAFG